MSIEEILKIPFLKLFVYMFCIFTSICPGILLLYMHKPELFSTVSTLVLIMLAIAITNPVFLLNIILAFQFIPFDLADRFEAGLFIGNLYTYTFFSLILLFDFFFKLPLNLVVFLIVLIQSLWVLSVIFFNRAIQKGFMKGYLGTQQRLSENINTDQK